MNTILVRIEAEQRVRFNQTVPLDRERWEQIKLLNHRDAKRAISGLLRLDDPVDWDDIDDVVVDVVAEDGAPIKPEDYLEL